MVWKLELKNGVEKGKLIGEKNQQIKIAKKLKEIGMQIEDIVKVTNLSKDEIEIL